MEMGEQIKPQHIQYIGITGLTSIEHIEYLTNVAKDATLMLGFLVSDKTFYNRINNHPNIFPTRQQLTDMLIQGTGDHLKLIHYNTHTDDDNEIAKQLNEITTTFANSISGIQLNIPWPNPSILEQLKKTNPNLYVVLQVGNRAQLRYKDDPFTIAKMVSNYADTVNTVLIDNSEGLGIEYRHMQSLNILRAISNTNPNLGLALAGGLCADNVINLGPIINEFNHLSIDAQGRLQNQQGQLDIIKATDYINKAKILFENI